MNKITHFEIPATPDSHETFGQKIEELKKHPNIKIAETAKKILDLKNEIEKGVPPEIFQKLVLNMTNHLAENLEKFLKKAREQITITEKTREFSEKNFFDLEIMIRIDDLQSPPDKEFEKEIYATALFGQKILIQKELSKFLRSEIAKNNDNLESDATKLLDAKFDELKKLDKNKNGKLEYSELLKDHETKTTVEHVSNVSPFFIELKKNKNFDLTRANVNENVPRKQTFIIDYLKQFTEKMIDQSTGELLAGSNLRLTQMMHTMILQVVGAKQLTIEKFRETWDKALEDKNVERIYSNEDKNVENLKRKFENLLASENKKIAGLRNDADKRLWKIIKQERANPKNLLLRNLGGMENVLVYFGKDALIATILLNLALAGFSPTKFLQNPVALGSIATVALIAKHYNPELFAGKSSVKKIKENKLKEKFKNAPETVQNWLVKFSKNDLDTKKGKLGKLLAEKGRHEISSTELAPFLKKDEQPKNSIVTGLPEARRIFLLFRACQQNEINPSSLKNQND